LLFHPLGLQTSSSFLFTIISQFLTHLLSPLITLPTAVLFSLTVDLIKVSQETSQYRQGAPLFLANGLPTRRAFSRIGHHRKFSRSIMSVSCWLPPLGIVLSIGLSPFFCVPVGPAPLNDILARPPITRPIPSYVLVFAIHLLPSVSY